MDDNKAMQELTEMTSQVYEITHRLHVKCNRCIKTLEAWNEHSRMIMNLDRFIDRLLNESVDTNKEYETLPEIIQLLCFEFSELTDLISDIFDGFIESALEAGYAEDLLYEVVLIILDSLQKEDDFLIVDEVLLAQYQESEVTLKSRFKPHQH